MARLRMPMRNLVCLALLVTASLPLQAHAQDLGKPLTDEDIPFYARHVLPDGTGLPQGSGTAAEGAEIYASYCASCHGVTGTEGPIEPVVDPAHNFARPAGQFWPYATTLFDYTRRAMPFHQPKSLSDDEVYALTAFILFRNGLIDETTRIDADTLPTVAMPNRSNFVNLWDLQKGLPY